MAQQLKLMRIGATVFCLGIGVALISPVQANPLKSSQSEKTENIRNARGRLELNNVKADESITVSLSRGEQDPRGQMQEIVDEKISELSPWKQRRLAEKHFPIILRQKPKTGIKKIYKSRSGVILKQEYTNGRVKYFDKSGNYLKQKNKDGSWQFKIGYSTERDWHLGII